MTEGGTDATVAVLTDRFARFESVVRDALGDLRRDFRDGLAQNGATLRTILDPESGYVPRAQIQLLHERADAERVRLERRVDELRAAADGRTKDVDARFDALGRFMVGTGLSIVGLGLTSIGIITAILLHH